MDFSFFSKDLCIKWSKKHKNTVFGYKKGSKTKSENKKIFFDPKMYIETFCTFVKNHIVFDIFGFSFFGKDLCIKWSKNTKIPFLVTKRGQKQNLKIEKHFSTQSCILKHFVLL